MTAASLPLNSGWTVGDIVYNNFVNPASNGVAYWVCVAGGVPGSSVLPVWKVVPAQ